MRHTADQPTDRKTDRLRLTVPEAAKALGISPEAVRNRLSRRTLDSEKVNGTVHVLIDRDMVRHTADMSGGTPGDGPADTPGYTARDELVDELRDRIHYLERQVEEEREARRRADTLLARLMDRVPELEVPDPSPASPEGREEAAQGVENGAGPQSGSRRPWWRRLFGDSQAGGSV